MQYGDLSSIVQLGVGLHVGTAVLQLYSELGLTPFERRLARVRELFKLPASQRPSKRIEERLSVLEGRYGILKIKFFNRYRGLVIANGFVALVLAIFLIVIAIKAEAVIAEEYYWFAIVAITGSFLPAPITLGCLAWDAHRSLKPLRTEADEIESEALTPVR